MSLTFNQTLGQKCEAIQSLLPLLDVHLWSMREARTVPRYGQATEREKDPDYMPPPLWLMLECEGRCEHCEHKPDCKGEPWEVLKDRLRKQYRLRAIQRGLLRLDDLAHFLAHAVVAVYADPYEGRFADSYASAGSEPLSQEDRDRRLQYARAGVRFIALNLPGDVRGINEERRPKRERIIELRRMGFSYRAIQRMLRCSPNTIRESLQAQEAAVGV